MSPAAGLGPAAALFHGFSDPTRLAILRHLATGEHKVRELTEHLGLAQSTVSAHLACLAGCGLVASRPGAGPRCTPWPPSPSCFRCWPPPSGC